VARNAAIAAMDLAGIGRMFPGRFVAGFGHGVASWMRQIGALPPSQLAALEETVDAVRRLLRGERLDVSGRHVRLDDVQLVFPTDPPPPVLVGAMGPRSLELAGRVSDGLMLPEGSSPAYVRAASELAGRPEHVAVYVLFAVDDDGDRAREAVAAAVAEFAPGDGDARLAALGVAGMSGMSGVVDDDRIERFAVAGTAAQCAAAIRRLGAAGATSVILVPQGDDASQLERAAAEVLPLVRPS
jgi:alkanesulfonate monooxygenase SsuD/methylene tetrahydromethanopterin reductase-like flavin-dependent oxidoreductase (luciferase family)